MARRPAIYGLLAEFERPSDLIEAVARTRQAGYRRIDAYTPYPVEGLAEALGFPRTRIPLVMFLGGLTGCLGGYFMQYYAAVIGYPINIGGRPLNSWPSFIPVTFELTVLLSALAGVFGLLGLCGLPMPYHPLFHVPNFNRATRDRFFLCIEATDPDYHPDATKRFLLALGADNVIEVPH
jgi:hypothetical protein